MSGEEWMHSLKACAEAQRRIPLELQASPPLPGRKGQGTAECWYYHLACGAESVCLTNWPSVRPGPHSRKTKSGPATPSA